MNPLIDRLVTACAALKPYLRAGLNLLLARRRQLPPIVATTVALIYGLIYPHQGQRQANATLPKGSERTCRVQRQQISDGDTLTVLCGNERVRVRLWGIDAPEMGQKPWGARARAALQGLLLDQRPAGEIFIAVQDIDRYGRVVAVVKTSRMGRDVGLELVRLGHASVYEAFNNSAEYRRVQAEAKAHRRGIWSTPGDQQNPAAWRRVNR